MAKRSGYDQARIGNFTGDNETWWNILTYASGTAAAAAFLAALAGITGVA